jgi:exonuclease VII large subunit
MEIIRSVHSRVDSLLPRVLRTIEDQRQSIRMRLNTVTLASDRQIDKYIERLAGIKRVLSELDPKKVLSRGYALVRGETEVGSIIEIEKQDILIQAEVRHVNKK